MTPFWEGERILAYHQNLIYEAKILKIEMRDIGKGRKKVTLSYTLPRLER